MESDAIDGVADDGGEDGDERNPFVARLEVGGHAEGEESEEGTVGVAGNGVDGVDDAGVVQSLETQDEQNENDHHAHMHPLASTLRIGK